jgi:eukaryotic-like serine/threonine-protein kinase
VTSLADGSQDNVAKAKAAALKAIALDGGLAEAHTALGAVYFFGERNFDLAEQQFKRALELNDHYATAHQWYAIALSENRRHEEARTHAQEAVREDPLNATMHQAFGLVRYYARDFSTGVTEQRLALQLNSRLPLARVVLAKSLILQGKPQEAVAVCEQTPAPVSTDVLLIQGIAHARSGDQRAADRVWKELSARRPRSPIVMAQWHAAMGNYDAAFDELKQSDTTALPAVFAIDPLFDGLRADRRFSHR